MKLKDVLSMFDPGDIIELFTELAHEGYSKSEAIELLANMLDKAIDWSLIVKEPFGSALELLDAPVYKALLNLAWKLAERRKEREEKRNARSKKSVDRLMQHADDIAKDNLPRVKRLG